MIEQWLGTINGYLWGSILIYLLTGCGIWFTWRLKFLQITRFTHMFTLLKLSRKADSQGISSFQALCTSLAARVGTGNLMGVAVVDIYEVIVKEWPGADFGTNNVDKINV